MPVFSRPSTDGVSALEELVADLEKKGHTVTHVFQHGGDWVAVCAKKATRSTKETRG